MGMGIYNPLLSALSEQMQIRSLSYLLHQQSPVFAKLRKSSVRSFIFFVPPSDRLIMDFLDNRIFFLLIFFSLTGHFPGCHTLYLFIFPGSFRKRCKIIPEGKVICPDFRSCCHKMNMVRVIYNGPAVKTKKEEIYREQLLI